MKLRLLLLCISTVFILSACGQNGIKDAKDWPIEDFSVINQEGDPVTLADLKGKVWVADFIFTNCDTICIPMTFNMVKLQTMAKEENIENVEFVGFSVDPEIDDPATLKQYGEQMNVDFTNFQFFTGYSQQFIEKFAYDNFKTLVKKPENEEQVIHQSYFYLVNQEGTILKVYSGVNDIPFAEIISDLKALQ